MVVIVPDPTDTGPTILPPVSIPSPGPLIQYAGTAEHAVWDNVFGWVKGTAKGFYSLVGGGAAVVADQVEQVVEAWAGQLLKSLSGFINELADFAADGLNAVLGIGADAVGLLLTDVLNIEDLFGTLEGLVANIADAIIPALLGEIIRIGGSIEPRILDGLAGVETWAIDNLYHPLLHDLITTAGDLYDAIDTAVGNVMDEIESAVASEALARVLAVAGLATALATITTWVEECGAPMCDTIGPKTDLGKFLKGLSLVGNAALLAELATLDADGIESLLRGLQALSRGVIDDLGAIFTGGETIGGAITRAGA